MGMEFGLSPRPRRLEGFPTFADFIASDKDAAIYRRFARLSSRTLLYQQSELHDLEGQLERLDSKDANDINNEVAQQAARLWSHYSSNDREDTRLHRELQIKIKAKIKEYCMRFGS